MGAKLNMDTGGEIINCAAKLFAKRGVGSVSLRDIADELGISKGTLHYYFKTKEDLICSCAENCVAVIGDGVFELMNGAARGGSAESVCEKFVSAFFDDASLPKLLVGLLQEKHEHWAAGWSGCFAASAEERRKSAAPQLKNGA